MAEQKNNMTDRQLAEELQKGKRGGLGGRLLEILGVVVIAAGAFTRNKAIMDKMQPLFYDDEGKEPVHIFTCSTCTGDGISMCEAIGADIDYVHRRVNMFGPMRHPYPGVTLNIGNGPMFRTDGVRYEKGFDNQEVSDLVFAPHRFVWKITNEANARAAIEANNERIAELRKAEEEDPSVPEEDIVAQPAAQGETEAAPLQQPEEETQANKTEE